ncbi:MAG TPA: response regulator [Candidatus Methylomirabilis sp.]|nr:response regulator [Candidatus Methylomirabilis sp.]
MSQFLRVILVDSDPASRASVRQILLATSSLVVAEFSRIVEALAGAAPYRPDLVILEVPTEQGGKAEGEWLSAIEELAHALPNTPILATAASVSAELVIRAIRAGTFDFLGRPVKQDELLAALAKMARFQRRGATEHRRGKVASVFSTKGGVGVTTIATNLAVCLAESAPGDVLLVDLDIRQSDVATFLNLRPTYSTLDAFEHVGRLDEPFLKGLLTKHGSGLWVLPGPMRMERIKVAGEQVKAGLEILRSYFEHVVLDLPHDMDPGTITALEASDVILFLVSPTVSALRSGAAGLAAFRHLGLDPKRIRIMVMRDGTGDEITLRHVREMLGLSIYWRTPSEYPTVVTAINRGEPVVTASPRSKIAKNLRELSDRLVNGLASGAEPAPARTAFRLPWMAKAIRGGK